jgi:hypothetical protein
LIDAARERLGTIQEVAQGLAENLPAPKQPSGRSRRRRRRRKKKSQNGQQQQTQNGQEQPQAPLDGAAPVKEPVEPAPTPAQEP